MKSIFCLLSLLMATCWDMPVLLAQPVYSWGKILDLGQRFDKPFLKSDLVKIDGDNYVLAVTATIQSLLVDDQLAGHEGGGDTYLLVFDRAGKVKKMKSWGAGQYEEIGSMAANKDGDIMVAINFESKEFVVGEQRLINANGTDILLLKLNRELELLWSKWVYAEVDAVKAAVVKFDDAGNSYLGATFNAQHVYIEDNKFLNQGVSGTNDILIAKFNADGELEWGKTYGGPYEDFVKDLEIDHEGHIFFGGQYLSSEIYFGNKRIASNGLKDVYMAEMNQDGKFLKAYGFGSELNDDLRDIEIGENDNLYLTGYFQGKHFFLQDSVVTTKSKGNDFFIASFDTNMKLNWVRSDGNLNSVVPYHIKLDEANNIYVHGRFDSPMLSIGEVTCVNSGINSSEIWVSRWDPSGKLIWSKSFGGNNWEIEGGFLVEGEDSFILTGNTESETINFGTYSLKKSTQIGQFLVRFDKQSHSERDNQLSKIGLEVFPSVVSNDKPIVKITALVEQMHSKLVLYITDQFGNKFFSKALSVDQPEVIYSFANFPSGLYYATVSTSDGAIATQKIIKD